MEILSDALSCRWGIFVNYLAAALAGGLGMYVVTFLAVPIGAILRVRNAFKTDDAIDRFFGIKPDAIYRDGRRIISITNEPSIIGEQYKWILSVKGFTQLFTVGAVFFVIVGSIGGAICTTPYAPPKPSMGITGSTNTDLNASADSSSNQGEVPGLDQVAQKTLLATVSVKKINVRKKDNTDALVISTLFAGDVVVLDARNVTTTWAHTTMQGYEGWIRLDLLTIIEGSPDELSLREE